MQFEEVGCLLRGETRPFSLEPAVSLGNLHSFARMRADEVRFELGEHRRGVEQSLAPWASRIVGGTIDIEFDFVASRTKRARRSRLVTTNVSPGLIRDEGFGESRAILIPGGIGLINIDTFRLDAKGFQSITLGGSVLCFPWTRVRSRPKI